MPDYFRGYKIKEVDNQFVFCDTGKPTAETWKGRPCGHCGFHNTAEGHDGCLGTLPGVINACCGHGQVEEAYIQLENGNRLEGREALIKMNKLMPDYVKMQKMRSTFRKEGIFPR